MKFDFDMPACRRGTHCYKWDEPKEEDVIPMWVADMDFQVAPAIKKALQQRVEHGIFGYTLVPEEYYNAVIGWFSRRHQWTIQREWIQYTTGVVPALSVVIKALTEPGDRVLIMTPVYNCFFSSIRNNGCEVVESTLTAKGLTYSIDWADFEQKCSDEKVKAFVLCNPHNPAGRVWTREELTHINDICMRHHVLVIADEIHCELVMPGHKYTPFAAVSQSCQNNSVTCNSPSKAFNTAGLKMANIICNNAAMRHRIDRAININEVCDVNPFGPIALMAAYNESEEWLDELNAYLWNNYQALCRFFREHLPELGVFSLEGTYLVWVDIRATGMDSETLATHLLRKGKVMVNSGTMYGKSAGEGYIRINIACPYQQMMEGLTRIKKCLEKL